MKRILASILIASTTFLSLSCAVSCNKENTESEKKEDTGKKVPDDNQVGPKAGVYTFTVSAQKGKWEVGDKIYVHGSYGPAAKTITLSASDISADGLTASAVLDDILEFTVEPDYLYAAWPAEAVIPSDGLMSQSTDFSVFDRYLAVAFLKDNDFQFVDASSCLKFKASGYTDFALAANQRTGLRFTSYSVSCTSDGANWLGHKDDGYPFLYGTLTGGEVVMWFPGTVSLDGGFSLYFGKGDKWTGIWTDNETSRIKAGQVKDLGDITGAIQPYSGPAPKMPEIGKRTKYTLALAELSGLCMSIDKDFMWAVGDEGDLAKIAFDGTLIEGSKVHIGGDCEAVTVDPVSKNLIIGTEPNTIYKVPYPDFNKKESLYSIADAKGYGNAGQEGITYYKDGMVYSGMQTSSELYCTKLATGEVVLKRNLRQIFPVITEIADLEYDPETDWLWIIDSEAKKLFALTGDSMTLLGAYSVKTPSNPESLCIDHKNGCIWVGDDYGTTSYLYRYDFTGLDDAIIKK